MLCEHILESRCAKGHLQRHKCHQNQPGTCRACQREDEKRQKDLQAEIERQAKRDREQAEHAAKMAEIDQQIRLEREKVADKQAAEERAQALEQKKKDLEVARRVAQEALNRVPTTKQETTPTHRTSSISGPATVARPHPPKEQKMDLGEDKNEKEDMKSAPEKEWDRQKRVDGVSNDSIDALMGLTGLEEVKAKILSIKGKVETVMRQGTDMKAERLGIVLLGNPGTGRYLSVCCRLN